jgi:hypothetical protein
VADRDVVFADQDLADDQSDDLLALLDGQVLAAAGEARAEPVKGLAELEVGLGVVQLGVERVQLRLQGGFAFAQLRGASAEFVERDELFLVAIEQASQRVLRAREIALERVLAGGRGVRGAEGLEPPVDLGSDQCRVIEQSEHAAPDELVDLGQAHRPVIADAAFGAAVPVGARAAVVLAQDPVLAARRAAVVRVAALAAGEDPLAAATDGACCEARSGCCAPVAAGRARTARRSRARAPRSASTARG